MSNSLSKILLFAILVVTFKPAKVFAQDNVIANFKQISTTPNMIQCSNDKTFRNKGGHLQGIQYFKSGKNEYVFLSGSSNKHAYSAVVKLGSTSKVISINNLMKKPYKHSGGIQIFQNYLAVGIEDNSKKDKSKVCLYDISDPENLNLTPISIIDRKGEPLRSTAGCVGLTKYKNEILAVVGDWDTKHLDFYKCKTDQLKLNAFKMVHTIIPEESDKNRWIDNDWHSYQNINLFTFNDDELYLIGLGHNYKGEDIADLYQLHESESGKFTLQKLASKTFRCEKESNFKAAAGVILDRNNRFQLYSSPYHISETTYLNYFMNSETK